MPSRTYTINSSAYDQNIASNYLLSNGTGTDLLVIRGSLSRLPSTFRQYQLLVERNATDNTVETVTNSTVTEQRYVDARSSIFIDTYTPAGDRGLLTVRIPTPLGNYAFQVSVNGAPAKVTQTNTADFTELPITVPSGRGKVTIQLQPLAASTSTTSTVTSTTSIQTQTSVVTTHSTQTSASTTQIPSSTTQTPSASNNFLTTTLPYIIAGFVGVLVIVGLIAVRRRR